jgi:hypothetical protein
MRVKYMQEIVQAIDDEDHKERKREITEIENFEKPENLKEVKKANKEERKKGKLYLEALQRDQEVSDLVFVSFLVRHSIILNSFSYFSFLDHFHVETSRIRSFVVKKKWERLFCG